MEGKHPKRRIDKDNPYKIFENDGHYYICFRRVSSFRERKISVYKYQFAAGKTITGSRYNGTPVQS